MSFEQSPLFVFIDAISLRVASTIAHLAANDETIILTLKIPQGNEKIQKAQLKADLHVLTDDKSAILKQSLTTKKNVSKVGLAS